MKSYTAPHSTSPWPEHLTDEGILCFNASSTLKIVCFIVIISNFSGKNAITDAVPDAMVFT